jgi:hypothetical protein
MTDNSLATVGDAIAALSAYDPTTPLRIATQPCYPIEHLLARVVCTPNDAAEDDDPAPTDQPVVWLGAGEQVGYVPALAVNALGWL